MRRLFSDDEKMPDLIIFVTALAILGIGVVMVFSSSSAMAFKETGDSFYYLKRQLASAVLGVVAMAAAMRIDYRLYARWAVPALLASFFMLAAVLVVGPEIAGSRRWIDIGGFNLQPSEIAKFAVVNFFALFCAKAGAGMRTWRRGLVVPLAALGLTVVLIMAEPDFGTAIAITATSAIILFAAGARVSHLGVLASLSLPLAGLLIWLEPYRMRRLLAFLDPLADPTDSGWNVIQSLLAIGSGGLFGLGLGESRQKFYYLPEQHTDFIFAILGEELGLLGTVAVVVLFFVLVWRGYRAALHAPDRYGILLGVGLTTMIVLQGLLNMGVVTGSMPVTGITLPLISYGGSSLAVTLGSIGILLNISRQ